MKIFKLLSSVVICLAAGFIGSIFTTPSIPTWYASLIKPVISPPNYLFAPVWTILYILMGIALFLVWTAKGKDKTKSALIFFFVQLGLNSLWSILFFGLKMPLLAFLEIIVLWIFILLTMLKFFKIKKAAGWLLAPYLAWVSFASILNFLIFWLNK